MILSLSQRDIIVIKGLVCGLVRQREKEFNECRAAEHSELEFYVKKTNFENTLQLFEDVKSQLRNQL